MQVINCGDRRNLLVKANVRSAQARHKPVLGEEAQERLSELTLGVVGLGGIGSELVEKLKRLFPRRLVLADDDFIEESNLNRVVGSTFNDARNRLRKTELASREIAAFNPDQQVTVIDGNFLDEEVQRKFKGCDVIFSATDNVASRFAVCAFGLANGCAIIDVATGIVMGSNGIEAAGGQVFWITPESGWCPLCSGLYEQSEIATGLLDPDELKRQRAQGYVRGDNIAAPQVGALNGILSGFAVWMFMRIVSGARINFDGIAVDVEKFSSYTWSEERKSPNDCHYCGERGFLMHGDSADMICRTKRMFLPEFTLTPDIAPLPIREPTPTSKMSEPPVSMMLGLMGLGQYTY